MAGTVYQVDSTGKAPKGVAVGDYVKTSSGVYEVLDSSNYKGLSKDNLAKAGVGFNPTTGLYSKKANADVLSNSANQYTPTTVSFDADAYRQSAIDSAVAKLKANYSTDKSNLSKTYNTNVDNYQDTADETNDDYNTAVDALSKQTYLNNIMAKQQASAQGLTSSGQGIALAQSAINNGNDNATSLYNARTASLASIEKSINSLTATYNIDKDSLLSAYHANEAGAMSDADLAALSKKLEIDTANAATTNSWNQTKYSTENSNTQAKIDRDAEKAAAAQAMQNSDEWNQKQLDLNYAQLAASKAASANSLAAARSSAGASNNSKTVALNAQKEFNKVQAYVSSLSSKYGTTENVNGKAVAVDWMTAKKFTLNEIQAVNVGQANVANGDMTYDAYKTAVDAIIKKHATPKASTKTTSWLDKLFNTAPTNPRSTTSRNLQN